MATFSVLPHFLFENLLPLTLCVPLCCAHTHRRTHTRAHTMSLHPSALLLGIGVGGRISLSSPSYLSQSQSSLASVRFSLESSGRRETRLTTSGSPPLPITAFCHTGLVQIIEHPPPPSRYSLPLLSFLYLLPLPPSLRLNICP